MATTPGPPSRPGRPLVTPEAVVLEFETAGLGSRILAAVIDFSIQGVVLVVGTIALAALAAVSDGPGSLGVSLLLALGFLTLFGYPTAFETLWRGRTPGKAALGLRVVTREGTPVRFRHAAVRAALTVVDFWVASGAVAVLSVLLTRNNQRLGDLAAGTLVLRERTGARRPHPVQFEMPPEMAAHAPSIDVSGLKPVEYTTVRSFLVRAPTLPDQSRSDLAEKLAGVVASRVRRAPPSGVSAEAFLMCVAALYQQRSAAGPTAGPAAQPPPAQPPPAQPAHRPDAASEPRDRPAADGGPFTPPQ